MNCDTFFSILTFLKPIDIFTLPQVCSQYNVWYNYLNGYMNKLCKNKSNKKFTNKQIRDYLYISCNYKQKIIYETFHKTSRTIIIFNYALNNIDLSFTVKPGDLKNSRCTTDIKLTGVVILATVARSKVLVKEIKQYFGEERLKDNSFVFVSKNIYKPHDKIQNKERLLGKSVIILSGDSKEYCKYTKSALAIIDSGRRVSVCNRSTKTILLFRW